MATRQSFSEILRHLRSDSATAEDVSTAVHRLSTKPYVSQVAEYLVKNFGREPKLTRVLIRASGKSPSRVLHDILAQRLMDGESGDFAYELIDALSETGTGDYAASIVPFLETSDDDAIRTTAAYALGMLQSPVAIRPLIRLYRSSRGKHMKNLCARSIRRILGARVDSTVLELYLTDAPKRTRERILEAIRNAA